MKYCTVGTIDKNMGYFVFSGPKIICGYKIVVTQKGPILPNSEPVKYLTFTARRNWSWVTAKIGENLDTYQLPIPDMRQLEQRRSIEFSRLPPHAPNYKLRPRIKFCK